MIKAEHRHTVLIVDDEAENLNLLENILGDEWEIHRASSGEEALRVLPDRNIHLILTDQRMPGMTGVALLEQVRKVNPDTVRMLITAYPDIEVAVEAINRGQVRRYVPKPFDPNELRNAIRQEFERFDLVQANRQLNVELGKMVNDLFQANQKLKDLDRLKDQFLASITHELKTPLVSGMGYVDLLLSGAMGPVDERHSKGLNIALRNMERLLGLIEDLLSLARMRRTRIDIDKDHFDLAGLIRECVDSLKGRARKKKLDVSVKIPPGLPRISGEEKAIHSVVTNVLANAEKFTPDQAKIRVDVEKLDHSRCEVRVEDNGIGLPPGREGDVIRLFRDKEDVRSKKYGGLGIGLMLSREILAAHGCSIRLAPRKRGQGTVVSFDLPLASPPSKKARPKKKSKKR